MNYGRAALWLARLTLILIFFFNVSCALTFVARPLAYTPGFEVSGVAGETWMLLALPPEHPSLATTGWRFVAFDGGGLVAMLLTFGLMLLVNERIRSGPPPPLDERIRGST